MAVDDRLRQPGRAGGEENVERMRERDRVEPSGQGSAAARPTTARPVARVGASRVRRVDPRARATAGPRGPRRPAPAGRCACHRSGSRRSRFGDSAPVAPAGRGRCAARTRKRRWPRSRRGSRWRGRPRASPGCSGGTRRLSRRGRHRVAAGRPAAEPPARAARRRSARTGPASASARGQRSCRRPRPAPPRALRNSVQRRGTTPPPGMASDAEHPLVRRVRPHLEEVPQRAPEALEVGDRPAVGGVVVGECESALRLQPVEVATDLARVNRHPRAA